MKAIRRITPGQHHCGNCGNLISDTYAYCTVVAFGRVVDNRCEREFSRYWAKKSCAQFVAERVTQLASRSS